MDLWRGSWPACKTAHDNSRPGPVTHPQTGRGIEGKAGYGQIDGWVDEALKPLPDIEKGR